MLHIMIVFSAVSPLVLENRMVLALRSLTWTTFRLALTFTVAAIVYFATLLALVEIYSLDQPLGEAVYGIGFMIATFLALLGGTLVSPARLAKIIIPGICTLAVIFPIGLYLYYGLTGSWRAIYLLYLIGSIAGGYGVTRLTSRNRDRPRLNRIPRPYTGTAQPA
jgi:hypothetical protein